MIYVLIPARGGSKSIKDKNIVKIKKKDDIADFLARFNRYTNWKTNDLIAKNSKLPSLWKLYLSIKWRFCKSYLFKKGYKEGALGILIALFCAIYPLVTYLKVKEKNNENS